MKNLKPSQLPANTVIDTENGEYIKRVEGYWDDMFAGYGCCKDKERISDVGCEENEYGHYPFGLTTSKTSDEYFTDYRVISVPPGFDVSFKALHGLWDWGLGTYSDGVGIHDCKGFNCDE